MKVVFALSAVLLQCLVTDAVMYFENQYTGADCTSSERSGGWSSTGVCWDLGNTSNPGPYIKAMCAGDDVEFLVYTDSACGTRSTADTALGDGACAVTASGGMYSTSASQCATPPSGCTDDKPKKRTCASQPEQVSITVWSNAQCTTPHPDDAQDSEAIGVCEFWTNSPSPSPPPSDSPSPMPSSNGSSGNGSMGNASSTNSSGNRRLQTSYGSKMSTWTAATGVLTQMYYETKDCSGTSSHNSTTTINSTCQMMEEGKYYKLDAHMTAQAAAAARPAAKSSTSGGDAAWSMSFVSVLMSLGVAKMLL